VGRERELAELRTLLKSNRLVTLTGPGGTGKTRLALQTARSLAGAYPHGAWLVELAPLSDPALLPDAILQALKINPTTDSPPLALLKRYLLPKQLLLLLDNFEHLLEGAAGVSALLEAAPRLSVLATSRERLRLYGEQEYPVSPLRVPDLQPEGRIPADQLPSQLLEVEAVTLFVQRARAAQPGFTLDAQQAPAVAQLCVRLDGLPLALELAASQVRLFPPALLAQRLQGSLEGLPPGPRDLPARQRTLHAAIEWSYLLLNETEKSLFARLAIFSGGGELQMIEHICAPGIPGDLLNLLAALVEKSLLIAREGNAGELRFSMLETIRAYALEQLAQRGELESLRQRHAEAFAALAERAAPELRTARQGYWFPRLVAEQDNLRSALAWSLEGAALPASLKPGLRLAAALRDFWYYQGYLVEGRRWTVLAVEKAQQADPALRAGVLLAASDLASVKREPQEAAEFAHQALQIYTQLGDQDQRAWALIFLGLFSYLFTRSPGKTQENFALCLEGLQLFRQLGNKPGIAQALNILGEIARLEGDDQAAQRYYEECLQVITETGEQVRVGIIYENLSVLAYHRRDYAEARRLVLQGLALFDALNNDYGRMSSLAFQAGPTAALGYPQRAATLLGASQALQEGLGITFQPNDQAEIDSIVQDVLGRLPEADFQQAFQAGLRMSAQEATAFALEQG
jgi:predicted ATPase